MNVSNGIIIINKPADWTSHDVVAKLRRVLKIKRIGHGGTLDPMATGVLPIFIGRATRAVEFFENSDKEYIAKIMFGVTTDTQDITGTILSTNDRVVTREELEKEIPKFLHAQKQIPPMYSAVKVGGKKLYELARKGQEIERKARDIYISEIELLDEDEKSPKSQINRENTENSAEPTIETDDAIIGSHEKRPYFRLRVACSKGTYIRTLCHDIGESLDCGAVMAGLERTKAGIFTLNMALTIDEVAEFVDSDNLNQTLLPTDVLFKNYPALKLSESDTKKCKNGMIFNVGDVGDGKYRVYGDDGEFLAISNVKGSKLKTIKSFFEIRD